MVNAGAYGDGFAALRNAAVETLYLRGDVDTPAGLRFAVDAATDLAGIQRRTNGVWNAAGFDVCGDRGLLFGQDVTVNGIGPHLHTKSVSQNAQYVHARTEFNDTTSAEGAITPRLGPKVVRSILQPDDSGEMAGNTITWTTSIGFQGRFVQKLYLDVATAATTDGTLQIRETDENGALFFSRRIGKVQMDAGENEFDMPGWVNEETVFDTLHWSIVLDEGGTVGLKSNVSMTTPWYAFDYQNEDHEHVAPMEFYDHAVILETRFGLLITTNEGDITSVAPVVEL